MKSAKELFKDSWLFFKAHWTTLTVVSIGFAIASYIYGNLIPMLFGGIFDSITNAVQAPWLLMVFGIIAAVVFLVYFIGSIILSCAQNLITPYMIQELSEDRPLQFKDSVKRIVKMVPSYLWISILAGLIVTGGFILFIVPGIYFAILFSFAITSLVIDGKKGFGALAHSQALYKGRFWRVIWKSAYPALYVLGLFAIVAMIAVPIALLVESMWVKVPILIAIGIPAAIALFILAFVTFIFTIKLYKELGATSLTDTNTDTNLVPKWLKVWTIIALVLIITLTTVGITFFVKNPEVIEKIRAELQSSGKSSSSKLGASNQDLNKTQVYSDFGLTFEHPGRFVDTGPNEMNGSLTVLSDALSPSAESGYMPQIAVLGYQPKDEVKNLTALDLIKRNFVPDFEAGKQAGEVIEYSIEEKEFNGYTFAILKSKELIEGQAAVTQTTLYKDQKTIYLFQAIALESEKDVLDQALSQILGSINISEMVDSE